MIPGLIVRGGNITDFFLGGPEDGNHLDYVRYVLFDLVYNPPLHRRAAIVKNIHVLYYYGL